MLICYLIRSTALPYILLSKAGARRNYNPGIPSVAEGGLQSLVKTGGGIIFCIERVSFFLCKTPKVTRVRDSFFHRDVDYRTVRDREKKNCKPE